MTRILIAGIGNMFLGDDAFGVEVARRLSECPLPDGVRVVDFGIRGRELAYALADDGYDAAILVDAASRGRAPGTLYVLEPDADESAPVALEGHGLDPRGVLRLARVMGTPPTWLRVVGCEPACLDEGAELSAPVAAAIAPALEIVSDLVEGLQGRAHPAREVLRA